MLYLIIFAQNQVWCAVHLELPQSCLIKKWACDGWDKYKLQNIESLSAVFFYMREIWTVPALNHTGVYFRAVVNDSLLSLPLLAGFKTTLSSIDLSYRTKLALNLPSVVIKMVSPSTLSSQQGH